MAGKVAEAGQVITIVTNIREAPSRARQGIDAASAEWLPWLVIRFFCSILLFSFPFLLFSLTPASHAEFCSWACLPARLASSSAQVGGSTGLLMDRNTLVRRFCARWRIGNRGHGVVHHASGSSAVSPRAQTQTRGRVFCQT